MRSLLLSALGRVCSCACFVRYEYNQNMLVASESSFNFIIHIHTDTNHLLAFIQNDLVEEQTSMFDVIITCVLLLTEVINLILMSV